MSAEDDVNENGGRGEMTEGFDILTTPDGAVLTLQALPGRGWRC